MFEKYWGYIPDQIDFIKLSLSIIVGGIVGLEREYRSKIAGFRTIVLICIGSTIFTICSIQLGGPNNPDRMAANIITGIGFLGAGAIFRDPNNLTKGLTTATIIWITAALGVGIGVGHFILVTISTFLLMIILIGFPFIEDIIKTRHQIRNYRVTLSTRQDLFKMENMFINAHLKASRIKHTRQNGKIISSWSVGGSKKNHEQFIDSLFEDSGITDFEF